MMNNFIKNPYLPINEVTKIIAGEGMRDFSSELECLGISVLYAKSSENLQKPVASHTDLLCNYFGEKTFFVEKSQKELFESLNQLGANVIIENSDFLADYPNDVKLNCVRIADSLICNKKTISNKILQLAIESDLKIIDVSQGYTKCSIVVACQNAVITDDININSELLKNGFDVLLVEKGDVLLNGYNYGFIGGCCSLISKNKMLFIGDIKTHRNFLSIKDFLSNYKIDVLCLNSKKLIDIGSFIPVFERN
ncbi:MAG: hypothetical protein RRZ68_00745 [Oscillospiraceae bacterium]